jgi:hypothetical protein
MNIDDVNKKFAIISVGNKVVVMETAPDGSIAELWPFEEFKKLLIKERIVIGTNRAGVPVTGPLADSWLLNTRGRKYDRLVYAMPGSPATPGANDYNGWLGFTVKPDPHASWELNRKHLFQIICSGNQSYFDWVMNWCAALIQLPGRHGMSALVLWGGQGIGKGHFAHGMLGSLFFGQQYMHIIGAGQLTGRFNEHLSGKSLIFADESTWGGDPKAADILKGLVTEDTVPIERKFLSIIEEVSALHIIIASNNDWPITIPKDDRRYMVLNVADTMKQNDNYFTPLRQELRDGGRAAMLYELLHYQINESLLRHPLSTEAKRDITTRSLTPIERWWNDKLHDGRLLGNNTNGQGEWPEEILKAELHFDYMEFLEKYAPTDRARRATEIELGKFLKKHVNGIDTVRREPGGPRAWALPALKMCQVEWCKVLGWPLDYFDEPNDQSRQPTEQPFHFS